FRSRGASSARDGNGHRTAKVGRRADPGLRRAGGGPGSARGEFFLCARSSEPAAAVQSRQPGSASALQGEDQKRTARRRFGVPSVGREKRQIGRPTASVVAARGRFRPSDLVEVASIPSESVFSVLECFFGS